MPVAGCAIIAAGTDIASRSRNASSALRYGLARMTDPVGPAVFEQGFQRVARRQKHRQSRPGELRAIGERLQAGLRLLAIPVMTSRSHACAGWLSSRRSQIMAVSIGLGGREGRWKASGCDFIIFRATLSGSTDTRSDVARICAADRMGARIAALDAGFGLAAAPSKKSAPNCADEISSCGSAASRSVENSRDFAAG